VLSQKITYFFIDLIFRFNSWHKFTVYTEMNLKFRANIRSYNTWRETEIVCVLLVRGENGLKNETQGIHLTGTLILLVIFLSLCVLGTNP